MDSKEQNKDQLQEENSKQVNPPTAQYVPPENRSKNKLLNEDIRRQLGWYLK
jgi:hypothetical protein